MSNDPQAMAFFEYIADGTPLQSEWREWDLRLTPMEVREALGYARRGLEGVLSVPVDKSPGPAWRFRWDVMPHPTVENAWWFTAYTSYSLAPDFPEGFAYIHLNCIGSRSESGEALLYIYIRDDLGWAFPYPEKAAARAVRGIMEYLRNWRVLIEEPAGG